MAIEGKDRIVISMEELELPALLLVVSIKVIENRDQLKYLRESAISPERGNPIVPHYFWAADDRWYQAVNIRKIKRTPFWMRFRGADDLMIADYQLQEISGIGDQWIYYYRTYYDAAPFYIDKDKGALKQARKVLRECSTSLALTDWMRKHIK